MLEKLIAAVLEIAASLKSIALSLEGARIAAPTTAAPAPAAAPTVQEAPKPAPAPAPVEDDLGLGDETKTYTLKDVKEIAKTAVAKEGKGRAFVKDALKKVGADTLNDIKPEKFAEFVELLSK